ncbi:MAG: hypothetical protein DMG17_20310 [Acidobacteria bacterium]|nr:MAG: hypothetical protein DMG17_20310 [Acidobacteriota bacterium]
MLLRQTNQSWSNIEKAVLALMGRAQAGFGTANVAAASRTIVNRILRETGISLDTATLPPLFEFPTFRR